jgi:F-type H+-transporting ATPase subunit epsilon
MAETVEVEIATPSAHILKSEALSVIVPGVSGDMEVLAGHTPILTRIRTGGVMIIVTPTREQKYFAVHSGFLEVDNDRVVVLARAAEPSSDIDLERAKAAEQRALHRIGRAAGDEDIDLDRARRALSRARARIAVSEGREE